MNIQRLYAVTNKNKITITAHKADLRMKFAVGNSAEENEIIEVLFSSAVEQIPDIDYTLRGEMLTSRVNKSSIVKLYNNNKSIYFDVTMGTY
jgi:hypothetical protein